MRQDKKAQMVIVDLFMAFLIISALLLSIVYTWNQYRVKFNERIQYSDMALKTMQLSDMLVKNPGSPQQWNESTVEIIGLAEDDRHLSTDKVNNFTDMTETAIKEKMQIGNYDFYFNLTTLDNTLNKKQGSIMNGKQAFTVRRYVIYENKTAELSFTLWQ